MITTGLVLVFAYAFYCCWVSVKAHTGYLICNNISGKLRAVGPGMNFMVPLLESLVEPGISLKTNSITFDVIFETKDEASIKLTISFEEAADPKYLVEYSSFEGDRRISDIKEKIKAMLSAEIRSKKDRDRVMDTLKKLAQKTRDVFIRTSEEKGEFLQQHFGTRIISLDLFPAALPEAVVAAKAEQEAQAKKNETQKLQADNFKVMANEIVIAAKEHGHVVSFEKAYRLVQLEHGRGNLKEEIHMYGIDQGSQDVIAKIVEGVIAQWLPKAK